MMRSRAELDHMARILQGIAVWGCLPGSPGQKAGINYGDIVLSVNGMKTSNLSQYLAARSLRRDGAEVVLFRDGIERSVNLEFGR